jgi:large subunit ribosomal protein L5
MKEIEIEKVVLNCGAIGEKLDRAEKLLVMLTGKKKIMRTESKKRIPSLGVRPGLELGCMVTLRNKQARELLRKLLGAVNNEIPAKKIKENHFSFGIKEYIEIPGVEFAREVGILGFNVTVVFSRKGKRVERRKIKRGSLPKRQHVKAEEIIEYMKKNYNLKIGGKE